MLGLAIGNLESTRRQSDRARSPGLPAATAGRADQQEAHRARRRRSLVSGARALAPHQRLRRSPPPPPPPPPRPPRRSPPPPPPPWPPPPPKPPPPPPRCGRSSASFTRRGRPSRFAPFMASMAFWASAGEPIVTNPNPRD